MRPPESIVIWVHYLPIATTILAAIFAVSLFGRYVHRKKASIISGGGSESPSMVLVHSLRA